MTDHWRGCGCLGAAEQRRDERFWTISSLAKDTTKSLPWAVVQYDDGSGRGRKVMGQFPTKSEARSFKFKLEGRVKIE